ncbi:MAG: hypothetical protein J6T94_03900 [Bacteroidaceae bacterium]|nr:hypothetical protein [Bacteroidaceae bacterium]
MNKLLKIYNKIGFSFLIVVSCLVYHPAFHVEREADVEVKSSLSKYVVALAALLVIPNIRVKKWFRDHNFRLFIIFLIPALVIALSILAMYDSKYMIADLRIFLIPFSFYLLGLTIDYSEKDLFHFALLFCMSALFVGYSQVVTNIGAFVILEQYMVSAKNSLSCIIATAIIIAFIYSIDRKTNKYLRYCFVAMAVASFVVLLTIRGRAGTLAVFIAAFIVIIKGIKTKKIKLKNVILITFAALFLLLFLEMFLGRRIGIFQYIYDSFFTSRSGDVSTGRISRNSEALEVLNNHFFTGRIVDNVEIEWVHNYVLRILSNLGAIVGAFMLVPYFYLLVLLFKLNKKNDTTDPKNMGGIVLIIPFVISLFEPTYPFSPGSTVFFSFFLLGYLCKSQNETNLPSL